MLLILLLGFGLRVASFSEAPPGLIHDEVRNWLNARLILGGDIRPLYPYGGGREVLYLLIQAVSFRLIGDNLLAARLPSIAFSMLGVALSFSLARRLFGRGAGMVAAAGMATSFWALMFSRLAVRTGSMPVMGLLVAYLTLRLLQGERPPLWHYVLAGLALGATLYTYPSALVFPAVLLIWVGLVALMKKEWVRGKWWRLGLSLAVAGIVAIPLARAWSDPATAVRAEEVDAPLEALLVGDIGPVLANVGPVLGVFSVRGDHGLEFNVQDQPIFPTPLMALFFYAGLGWALWKLFDSGDERRPGYALALLWLVGMLIPTLVTERPVNPSRTIGLLGIVYVFPAITAVAAHQLARRARHPLLGTGVALVVVLGVALQLGHTARGYFTTWNDNPVIRFLYQDEYRLIAADLDTYDDASPTAVGGLTPYEMDPASMYLLMADKGQASALGFFDPQTALLVPSPGADDAVHVIVPDFITLHPVLAAHLDGWGFRPDPLRAGAPCTRYTLQGDRATVLSTATGAEVDFHVPGDLAGQPLVMLVGLEMVGEAEPGGGFTLLTGWRAARPSTTQLRIFVHLTDEAGNIVAQSDVLGVPAPQWREGDLIVQAHDLFLPGDAPPGPYWLNVGLYDPVSGVRLATPDLPTGDHVRGPLP
jgi:hypothetical protein